MPDAPNRTVLLSNLIEPDRTYSNDWTINTFV